MMLARSALRSRYVVGGLVSAAAGGTLIHKSQTEGTYKDAHESSSSSSLMIPTMQATMRAVRLAKTAVLIASDYKMAEWGWVSSDQIDEQHEERQYWEAEAERRRNALEEAQEAYSIEEYHGLDLVSRLEVKKQQKITMTKAAEELAEAEDMLATLGSKRSLLHQRAAKRLLDLCHANGGVYIKIGQHLANLDYLIPMEYVDCLSALFDDTPRTDYRDVRAVIREDLGTHPEELFDKFEAEPIASASLAQVHVAYEKDTGRKLAIKVQHRGLRETSAGDLFALVSVVRIAERLFKDFTWGWIAEEIAPHLPKELDFLNEGKNAERAAEDIKKTDLDCIIPRILWNYSSPRVLTMEFEEGFKATDTEAIEKAGLRKHDVAKLISSVFSSQAFLSAFVHCDPHIANVLIREKNGKPQMILVDHGLYRELDDDFCLQYAGLWRSLMLADLDGIKEACHSLGVDEAYTLFAAMLTARPFDEIVERSKKGTLRQDVRPESRADQAVIRGYAQRFLRNIFDLLNTVPRQMLLLLKMNDCLRHIDYSLGSPTNTMIICGKYAAKAICEEEMKQSSSWLERFRAWWSYFNVVLRIQVHDFGLWWHEKSGTLRYTN